MMRRVMTALLILGLSAGVMVGAAGGASAYPPGRHLTVAADPHEVSVGRQVNAIAKHVQPGCSVTFTLGSQSVTVPATGRHAVAKLNAPTTKGQYTLTATTTGCTSTEQAFTRIQVTKRGNDHGH
jgi:hypothetical protein